MHGLINRAIQNFLCDTYGHPIWQRVVQAAELPPQGFEALLIYEDALTEAMVRAASEALGKPRDALLEDFGIYLAGREGLRRLLRFGGADFVDFLYSLEELPGRIRLAVPDIALPEIALHHPAADHFRVEVQGGHREVAHVLCGILQAMADDFGALALIGADDAPSSFVRVELVEACYAVGRDFLLTLPEGT